MTDRLQTNNLFELDLNNNDFLVSNGADIFPTILGREYQFIINWNAKYGQYSLEVRDTRGPLDKWYPRPGHEHLIKNFHPLERSNPDAIVKIVDTGEGLIPAGPDTLGSRHILQVLTGRVIE